jgi:Glu-tRNA(Gln) amidotransferase subunit E-like FAD-binding protein
LELLQDAVLELMVDLAKGKKINWDAFKLDDSEIEKRLQEIVNNYPDLNLSALMGEAMKVFRGKVSGKKIMEVLKRLKGV